MQCHQIQASKGTLWSGMTTLRPPMTRIKAFRGTQVEVLGSCTVYLHAGKITFKALCQVADTDECFLMGRQAARVMRYVGYPEISPPAHASAHRH